MLEELLAAIKSTRADIAQYGVFYEGFHTLSKTAPLDAVYCTTQISGEVPYRMSQCFEVLSAKAQ